METTFNGKYSLKNNNFNNYLNMNNNLRKKCIKLIISLIFFFNLD